jgi:hypothetical protein
VEFDLVKGLRGLPEPANTGGQGAKDAARTLGCTCGTGDHIRPSEEHRRARLDWERVFVDLDLPSRAAVDAWGSHAVACQPPCGLSRTMRASASCEAVHLRHLKQTVKPLATEEDT